MPNLSEIEDSDAVDSIYAARAVVYVEADVDSLVFARLVGMRAAQEVDFKVPRQGHGGWEAVCTQVSRERVNGNQRVFGLIDGEAAVSLGRWQQLIGATGAIFDLSGRGGMLCLADHELENLLLRHGDICGYIADNVTLSKLSSRPRADIEETLRRLTRRFFHAAVLGYAVQHLHQCGQRYPSVNLGKFQNTAFSTGSIRADLKRSTVESGLSWNDYVTQVYSIIGTLRLRFQQENMPIEIRSLHLLRLADGKELLKRIIGDYKASSKVEGHLVRKLIDSDYASVFRNEILKAVGG